MIQGFEDQGLATGTYQLDFAWIASYLQFTPDLALSEAEALRARQLADRLLVSGWDFCPLRSVWMREIAGVC